jgi:hypothetical protein
MDMDNRELTKKIVNEALGEGVIPPHLRPLARRFAETGLPWYRVALSDILDWAEEALRLVVRGEMWYRSREEVSRDKTYKRGFVRRYFHICKKYGISPNRELLRIELFG